ncbi:helicase-exonuclease AddAB subunit AddA [Clostridium rectalis]|uniref:helicase-exonuclease AddAB subunit AddA n=1 Tax=Clostridium rectalis TaxID=2040295 RepID=UPI000F62FE18|nr:helicase-exonuclease AddAB subunit AddA [Clostridium rectalis]
MAKIEWTKEQESAIYTDKCNLLVAAAAGSGKTAVLVQRIIEKIINKDNPIDIDRLLVVTFTNAAASEMRERIGEAISKELDKNPDSKNLQRQLTLLNKASITTIHSFCLQVIRNNFHLLDIDPRFRVGDSTETILLKGEALDELFEDMYNEKNCTDEFLQLVDSYGGKDDLKLVDTVGELYNFSQSLPWPYKWLTEMTECFNVNENFNFKDSKLANILMQDISIELQGLKVKILNAINLLENNQGLNHYLPIFKQDLLDIEKVLNSKTWDDVSDFILKISFLPLPRKKVDESLRDIKDKALNIRKKVKEKIEKIKENIVAGTENIGLRLSDLYPRMKCLSKLVMEFNKRYSQKKREKNIIDFNDIEHFALEILTDFDNYENVIPSSIAIEFRKKFEEILVDEYQDSNLVQESILNSVSRQPNIDLKEKNLISPNMFMVGDVKQSIYRFRQAKPELFLEKYNNYSEEEKTDNRKIKLFKNFRSREEIIDGVNFIFYQIMCKNIGDLDYNEGERLNVGIAFNESKEELNYGGPIEVHLLEKNNKDSMVNVYLDDNDIASEDEEGLDNIQLEANMIVKIINRLINGDELNKPFKVLDKDTNKYRKIQFRDIVILMRATKSMAPVFIEEFNNSGIPIFADANSGYFETTEVKTILSLLQMVDNPRQDIPILAVLRSPIFSFTAEDIIDIRLVNKDLSIYENIEKIQSIENCNEDEIKYVKNLNESFIKKICKFLKKLNIWRNKALHMAIDQFIWGIYTDTGYYGYVGAMPGGIQRQANLRILFERAKQFESTSYRGLFNFITFINKLKNSSGDMGSAKVIGENEDVVRIMSIHKSKGLEFPVVITAGMGKGFNLQDMRKSILFHHEIGFGPDYVDLEKRISYPTILKQIIKKKIKIETLSEEMRILYVALTRAKEKLIITGMVNKLQDSIEKWCELGEIYEDKIPDYALLEGKNYLDWIIPAISRHKDCLIFREIAGSNFSQKLIDDNSKWKIKIWDRIEFIEEQVKDDEKKDIIKELEILQRDRKESKYKNIIEKKLEWVYKYKESFNIPAKFSVSEIKSRLTSLNEENTEKIMASSLLKKPLFLENNKKFSQVEIGTITHTVMQHIDIKKIFTKDDIKKQLKEMILSEFITEEQSKVIKLEKIFNFFNSSLGKRMKKSNNIKREIPFYIEKSSTDFYKELPQNIYANEKILIQGVIDAYFEEDDELIIIDYKTDYVKDLEMIKEKYSMQLNYYCEALERITHKKVKEKYLYLFYCDKEVKL